MRKITFDPGRRVIDTRFPHDAITCALGAGRREVRLILGHAVLRERAMATAEVSSPAPRVSVLMTTYNGARFIADSIDSVLAQSFGDFELVVVDDNSTDDTISILSRYVDPRLRILRNAVNLGVVGARNRGFIELRGAYVATIDHDDLWLPTRLEKGVALLDHDPATVLVATHTLLRTDKGLAPIDRLTEASQVLFRWILLMHCPVVYSSLLFRRETARRADGSMLRPDLRYADDHELMLRLASAGGVALLSEALTIYRVHATNTTLRVRGEMQRSVVALLTEQFRPWLDRDAEEAARLVGWHIAWRQPVTDRTALRRLGSLLQRLVDGFVDTHRVGQADRQAIEHYVQQVYWRALRAGLRRGHPWLLGFDRTAAPGSVHALGRPADVAASLAVGLLRLPMRLFTTDEGMPPSECSRESQASR